MPDDLTDDLNAVQRAMQQLAGPLLEKFKSRTTYYVAVAIKGIIQPYPGPVKYTRQNKDGTKGIIWPSEKSRRYYFAMRREAGLPMKYTRGSDPMSQRVQQSWAISRRPTSATLGNRATYAPYVASEQYQTEQPAATGFTTDAEAAERVMTNGMMERIIEAQLRAIIREAFRGLE